ncbi:MAG: DUF5011 domain-containing protein, partial [Alteromonadales bacterium]|nr:DUF5011 domain-containing protein [Alteromonadales bacterium]
DADSTAEVTGSVETLAGTYTISYDATDKAGNKADTITRSVVVVADDEVDPFALVVNTEPALTEAFLNHAYLTDAITVNGINTPVEVSIENGEFSIDGGTFTNQATMVTEGQVITVNVISSAVISDNSVTSLNVGSVNATFSVDTRDAEPSGLFTGTGTIDAPKTLDDLKGIIYNEKFMIFSENSDMLFDGTINSYSGQNYNATVNVYVDGAIALTDVPASATVVNGISAVITLTGTGLGDVTLTIANNQTLYERDATDARFKTVGSYAWWQPIPAFSGEIYLAISSESDEPAFDQGQFGPFKCAYNNATRTSPNEQVNVYKLGFDSEQGINGSSCNHLGENFQGFATIFDGGPRGTDGLMWFISANGSFSSFGELEYGKG